MKYPRILFFINNASPTFEEELAADQLVPCQVSFRNARFVPDTGALEECDGVFGDATPDRYKKAFPTAEDAIAKFVDERKTEQTKRQARVQGDKQKVADHNAKEAEDAAKKADEEAKAAADKAKEANKTAKAKKIEAKDATANAKDGAETDPDKAAPTVEKAAAAANAWTGNGDAT